MIKGCSGLGLCHSAMLGAGLLQKEELILNRMRFMNSAFFPSCFDILLSSRSSEEKEMRLLDRISRSDWY